MKQQELLAFFDATVSRMRKTMEDKNADYAGANDENAFANFNLIEAFKVTQTEVGFFTRMTDKMARIASFIRKGTLQVKDESVADTLIDLANYSILFAAYLSHKRSKAPGDKKVE